MKRTLLTKLFLKKRLNLQGYNKGVNTSALWSAASQAAERTWLSLGHALYIPTQKNIKLYK